MAYKTDKQRRAAQPQEVAHYKTAADLASTRYTKGLTNFLDVLDAQRSLYTAQDSLVQSSAAIDIDLVSLYKALGGGWEHNDPVMPSNRSKSETGAR